jgi:hypothetical protein
VGNGFPDCFTAFYNPSDMDLQVKLNGKLTKATVVYATEPDYAFIEQWRAHLGDNPHPHRRDAVEFAELAVFRYDAQRSRQHYARSMDEFNDYIVDNPHNEVACFVYLKCDWFPDCEVIGVSHFRRTWTNRIILDYLCAHPLLLKTDPAYSHKVRGVGLALLYFVAQVAKKYNCDTVWGEATQNSCAYYEGVFELGTVRDLIFVPEKNFLAFCDTVEAGWRASQPSAALEEIYKAEEENPPFVGNKLTVHGPTHTLVVHFLELTLPQKMEVAAAVGYIVAKPLKESDSVLFRHIFNHSSENKKLNDFWSEVERRHPRGTPDAKPFPKN